MAVLKLNFDVYFKNKHSGELTYIGNKTTRCPVGTDATVLTWTSYDTWSDSLVANSNKSSTTVFTVPWFIPTGLQIANSVSPKTLLAIANPYWSWGEIYQTNYNVYLRLKGASDEVNRDIEISVNEESDYSDNRHSYGIEFKYIRNGLLITTISTRINSEYTLSGSMVLCESHFTTLPFADSNGDVYHLIAVPSYYTENAQPEDFPQYEDVQVTTYYTKFDSSSETGTEFATWVEGYEAEEDDDPYPPPDPEDPDPGTGGDDSDDPTPDPLPSDDAIGTGFVTIFKPSKTQLRNLSGLFWNETFVGAIRNYVENITDMFVSLGIIPFDIPAGRTVDVTWFGITTGVTLTLASAQFIEKDMGSINLASDLRINRSGSALDYSPFSTIGIYLPFIGYRELDIDDVRDKTVALKYRFDILSGECVALISVGGSTIYEFTGNCIAQIPITAQSFDSLITAALNVAIATAGGIEGGAAGAMEGASKEKLASDTMNGNIAKASFEGGSDGLLSATANSLSAMKPTYSRTGSISGAAAMLAVLQPFLFLKTPRSAIPNNYNRYCGFPSNQSGTLGSFSGYTVVENIRLNNLVATSDEITEIYSLLKKGVIV